MNINEFIEKNASLENRIRDLEKERDAALIYRHFFENSRDIGCVSNSKGQLTLVNSAFCELLGYTKEEIIMKQFSDFIHPEDLDKAIKHGLEPLHENRYLKKDGSVVHLQWMSTKNEEEDIIFAVARDITEKKELEFEVKHKKEMFRASQRVAQLGNFSFSTADGSLYWSDELYNIFGIKDEERQSLYETYVSRFDKEGFEAYSSAVEKALETGENYAFQHKVYIPGGRVKTVECVGVPFTDEKGRVYRIDGVVQDVTDRVEDEETIRNSVREKEFLIKELHHRVKNNLQVISSLLSLQSNLLSDIAAQNHLKECQNRIKSMASIHDMLYRSDDIARIDFSTYSTQLVNDLVHSYRGDRHDVKVDYHLDDLYLSLDIAVPLGLLINEVVTNSLKHAFKEVENPLIGLKIKREDKRYNVFISDNGGGFNVESVDHNSTLGLLIIDTLGEQLEAEYTLESDQDGTRYIIQISGDES